MVSSPSMIRVGEFSNPLGFLGLDLASLFIKLVIQGLAGAEVWANNSLTIFLTFLSKDSKERLATVC